MPRLIVPPDDIAVPSKATLDKYGLSEQQWLKILKDQGWVCPICKKKPNPNPKTGKVRFVTDHFHIRGFKKMSADKKRLYVRGITDWFCNHSYLGRGITLFIARNVVAYLEAFEARKPK